MGLPYARMTAWRRYENTDSYAEQAEWCYHRHLRKDPETFLRENLSKFRNDIYNYGLQTSPYDDENTKSIYLYLDGFRIMRVGMTKPKILDIEFRNEDVANQFFNTSEALVPGRFPKREKDFDYSFKYNNYYLSSYYYTWPYVRYVKVNEKKEPDSITI